MKKLRLWILAMIMAIGHLGLTCCEEDKGSEAGDGDQLTIFPDQLSFEAVASGAKQIKIIAEVSSWDYDCNSDWLDCEKDGNILNVKASDYYEDTSRIAQISISSPGYKSNTISVLQSKFTGKPFTIDKQSLEFDFDSEEVVVVEVSTRNPSWEYESKNDDWLTINKEDNRLLISVKYNESRSKNQGEITLTSGKDDPIVLPVLQMGYRVKTTMQYIYPQGNMVPSAISDNGRYVVGYNDHCGFVWDTDNEGNDAVHYLAHAVPDNNWIEIYDVSNDGVAVAMYHNKPGSYDHKAKQWTLLDVSALGIDPSSAYTGAGHSITPDGNIIVGYVNNDPVIWKNGVPEYLDNPSIDHIGYIPGACRALHVDVTGTKIYGWQVDTANRLIGTFWDNEMSYIAPEMLNYEIHDNNTATIHKTYNFTHGSPNGRYAGGIKYELSPGASVFFTNPYVKDMQTGELTIVDNRDMILGTVDDNGTVYLGSPYLSYERTAYLLIDNELHQLNDWLRDNYYFNWETNGGTITGCTPDGKTIVTFTFPSGSRINVIRLGEKITE